MQPPIRDTRPPSPPNSVAVVGTGLIGTSIALALRGRGVRVYLSDADAAAARMAADLGAGDLQRPSHPCDVAVLAVPPALVGEVYEHVKRQRLALTFTDVASVKSKVLLEVQSFAPDGVSDFVGGHPMAGRERSGPRAARSDLFVGRPWVLTPTRTTSPEAVAAVQGVVLACGAVPVQMPAPAHDDAVALVSHAPQVLASLMAARLAAASDPVLGLSGQGVRDVTRLAASDPQLWRDILTTNAVAVAAVLREVRTDLDTVLAALEAAGRGDDHDDLVALLEQGNRGRRRIPGKHGTAPTLYTFVPVVVSDRPRELARLLADAADSGVNVEDVRIEHAQGQPLGLVELAVLPEAAAQLATALTARGWSVQEPDPLQPD